MILALGMILSFVITLAFGRWLIPALRALKAGQSIKDIGPTWHMSKQGTPTMGGLMFILGIFVAVVVASIILHDIGAVIVFVFALVFGAIGFFDDYQKVKKHENTGLTSIQKFVLQLVASIVFAVLLLKLGYLSQELYIPFVNISIHLPLVIYMVFAAFVIVGTVNSVNLTDGVDGLATGVTMPVMLFFTGLSWYWGYTAFGVFAASVLAALCAFLIYNFHPAKVFMGDTGSLFLGGAVCGLAFALDVPLILILVGIIYICETLSDILQVAYFKLTHGKRIFKMAPLHHHFEMCGWSEEKLFAVFTGITVVMCIIAYIGCIGR